MGQATIFAGATRDENHSPGSFFIVARVFPEDPAQIFISCGQSKNSDELSTAKEIAIRLDKLGYRPYVAVQEQVLLGVAENIFEQLGKSEYFVFVDFKRERLNKTSPAIHRGSLFSHQELAVAHHIGLDVLALQERGVRKDDGLLGSLQLNAIEFSDRHLVAHVIASEIQKRHWSPHWKNALAVRRNPASSSDAHDGRFNHRLGRYFFIDVTNRHYHKMATNCYALLENVVKLDPLTETPVKAIELKWSGYIFPWAHIPAEGSRSFDAFFILHDHPLQLRFNTFSDSTDFVPNINGQGSYELRYVVIADNFPPARCTVTLDLNSSLELTTLR
jgi:hypothetical protein